MFVATNICRDKSFVNVHWITNLSLVFFVLSNSAVTVASRIHYLHRQKCNITKYLTHEVLLSASSWFVSTKQTTATNHKPPTKTRILKKNSKLFETEKTPFRIRIRIFIVPVQVYKCNGLEWSKDRTQTAESVKMETNQVILLQQQTIFSTHKILTRTHR